MLRALSVAWILFVVGVFAFVIVPAHARGDTLTTYMVCPSVSTNNPNGMWVVGAHGAYFVLMNMAKQGTSAVLVTVPMHVETLAEVPADGALYMKMPTFPFFQGMAMLMGEGLLTWIPAGTYGFAGDTMVMIMINGSGASMTTTIEDMTASGVVTGTVTINGGIPIWSAVLWSG